MSGVLIIQSFKNFNIYRLFSAFGFKVYYACDWLDLSEAGFEK